MRTPRPGWRILLALVLSCAEAGSVAGQESQIPLRVMTYNIHAGHGDLARVAEVIRDADADVVALQEVDVHWGERSAFANQASELAAATGMEVRFGPIYTLPGTGSGAPSREFGVAVLSRLPVVDAENHALTRLSTQTSDGDAAEPAPLPGFLQVVVDAGGTRVNVFTTHLDYRPDPSVRTTQVTEMLDLMAESRGAVILMGDLNAPPAAPELQPLFARLTDAWTGSTTEPSPSREFTYPAEAPVRRIDYVLVSGGVSAQGARVIPAPDASDHLPVVAEVTVTTTSETGSVR